MVANLCSTMHNCAQVHDVVTRCHLPQAVINLSQCPLADDVLDQACLLSARVGSKGGTTCCQGCWRKGSVDVGCQPSVRISV